MADNRLNEDSEWVYFFVSQELKGLEDIGFDKLWIEGWRIRQYVIIFRQNDDLSFNDLS